MSVSFVEDRLKGARLPGVNLCTCWAVAPSETTYADKRIASERSMVGPGRWKTALSCPILLGLAGMMAQLYLPEMNEGFDLVCVDACHKQKDVDSQPRRNASLPS